MNKNESVVVIYAIAVMFCLVVYWSYLVHLGHERLHQTRLACIESGKVWITLSDTNNICANIIGETK